jgi:phospholipid/cholesterol/gamma-HCH transport system permease protein
MIIKTMETVGRALIRFIEEFGLVMFLLLATLAWMLRPPLRLRAIFKQMEFVGVNSLVVVILTGAFTGAVLALQAYHGFRLFSAESLVGSTVGLAMTRELEPVLTSLMVTARAGSPAIGCLLPVGAFLLNDSYVSMTFEWRGW